MYNFMKKSLNFSIFLGGGAILLSACGGGGGGLTACSHLYCFSQVPVETTTFTINGETETTTDRDPVYIERSDESGTRSFILGNTVDDSSIDASSISDTFSRTSKSTLSTHSSIDQEDGDWNASHSFSESGFTGTIALHSKLKVYGYSKSSVTTTPTNLDALNDAYDAAIAILDLETASGSASHADGRTRTLSATYSAINPFTVGGSIPTNPPTSGTFTYGGLIIEHNDLFQFRESHKMGSFSLELDFGDSTFEFKDVSGSTVRLVGSGELSSDGSFRSSDLELLSNNKLGSSAYGSILGNGGSHVGGIWHTNEDSNYKFGAFVGER